MDKLNSINPSSPNFHCPKCTLIYGEELAKFIHPLKKTTLKATWNLTYMGRENGTKFLKFWQLSHSLNIPWPLYKRVLCIVMPKVLLHVLWQLDSTHELSCTLKLFLWVVPNGERQAHETCQSWDFHMLQKSIAFLWRFFWMVWRKEGPPNV